MLLSAALLLVLASAGEVLNLGTRRELFVDRFLIDSMRGGELRLREPRDGGTVRGIPTEEVLAQMRQSDPPIHCLVGTPKGRLTRYEQELLDRPWQVVREGVQVKLLPQDTRSSTCWRTATTRRTRPGKGATRGFISTSLRAVPHG